MRSRRGQRRGASAPAGVDATRQTLVGIIKFVLAVVVLNYNGGRLVRDCLASIARQSLAPLEIVCVDNGSTDGSDREVESEFPDVTMLRLGANLGFAAGMNRGIAATTAEFVALLNLDVVLDTEYLARCVAAISADPALGGVTGKLLRPDDREPPILDSTGHIVYRNRRAVDRGEREPDRGQYDAETTLFSVCGAAPLYRRTMLDDIAIGDEYFDEDFFMYFEDFDIAWRAQLRGWHFAFAPDAVAHHLRGGSGGKAATAILACNHRNRLLVMLRNDHPRSFLRHAPGILYTELRASLHMLVRRPAALVLAWLQFFKLLPRQYGKRRIIQRGRRVGWKELEPAFAPYDYGIRPAIRRARERAAIR